MATLVEITFAEKVFFEIQRLKKELENLEGFVSVELKSQESEKPKTSLMIDPRSGLAFREKNK